MAADSPGVPAVRLPLKLLLAAALCGLLVRLAFGLGYWQGKPLTRDEQEYLSLARSLARGDGFVYDDVMRTSGFVPFGRAPGYPAFLAIVGGGARVTADVPAPVKIAQSFAGALGVFLAGLIATRIGGPRLGATAAAITAIHPPLVWISAYALSEALYWPLGLGVVWLADRAFARGAGAAAALGSGLLIGAAVLVRPGLLLFVPLALGWLVHRRRLATAALIAAVFLAVVGPWTLRNYAHHGTLIIVASDGGVTFWTGNHPLAIGEGDMAANPAIKRENQALRARYPDLDEEQMEPIYYREALSWIGANPVAWIVLELRKLFYLVVPIGPSYTLHSPLYFWTSVASYGAALMLAIAGVARLGVRRWRSPALWLMTASAVAVCLIFFPQERFRIPTIDPALVIFAAAGLVPRRDLL